MNIEIANRLVSLRKEKNLSQEALAAKLGISRQAVSKWERAEASPDTDNIILLAKLYGISIDSLLRSEDSPIIEVHEIKAQEAQEIKDEDSRDKDSKEKDSKCEDSKREDSKYEDSKCEVTKCEDSKCEDSENKDSNSEGGNDKKDDKNRKNYSEDDFFFNQKDEDGRNEYVHVGMKGIHVRDKNEEVHVGWDGIHVKDKGGGTVHVSWRGIHVTEANKKNKNGSHYSDKYKGYCDNKEQEIYEAEYRECNNFDQSVYENRKQNNNTELGLSESIDHRVDNKKDGLDNMKDGLDNMIDGLDNMKDGLDNKKDGLDNKIDGLDNMEEEHGKKGYENKDNSYDSLSQDRKDDSFSDRETKYGSNESNADDFSKSRSNYCNYNRNRRDSEVHISQDGIFVNGEEYTQDDWIWNWHSQKKNFPIHIVVILGYLITSICFNTWHPGWLVFFLIPLAHGMLRAVKRKNPYLFPYPTLMTLIFLILVIFLGKWHPSWAVFLTIPIYYSLVSYFRGNKRYRNNC